VKTKKKRFNRRPERRRSVYNTLYSLSLSIASILDSSDSKGTSTVEEGLSDINQFLVLLVRERRRRGLSASE